MSIPFILQEAGIPLERVSASGTPPFLWHVVGEPPVEQGWKLHLSCRSDEFESFARVAAASLAARRICFKVAADAVVAYRLNDGEGGFGQVGKIFTIYPASDEEASHIGTQLCSTLDGWRGPVVENEIRLSETAPVYARYGGFVRRSKRISVGLYMPYLLDGLNNHVPDIRSADQHLAVGATNPFEGRTASILPPVLDSRFVVVGQLAETRHSRIYAGVDAASARECVLKVGRKHSSIDERGMDAVARLRWEHGFLQDLEEIDEFPRVMGWWEDPDRGALCLESIRGHNLLDWRRRSTSEQQVRDVAMALCRTFRKCQDRQVILGDLNPPNVVVCGNDELSVRLIDLEFASRAGVTTSTRFGTHGYTDPRVIAEAPPSLGTDRYSLAALLFFLATSVDLSSIPGADRLLRSCEGLSGGWAGAIRLLVLSAETATGDSALDQAERLLSGPLGPPVPAKRPAERHVADRTAAFTAASGDALLRMADGGESASPGWTSRHPLTRGDVFSDLHMGDAGVAIALARSGLAVGRVEFLETAIRVAESLWEKCWRLPAPLPGFFVGEGGAALLFLSLHEVLGDQLWLDRAVAWSRAIGRQPCPSPDLMHGLAGVGLLHTWVYEYSGASEDLTAALVVADRLLDSAERRADGAWWKIPEGFGELSGQRCFGIAHGTAGITYFLCELMRVKPSLDTQTALLEVASDLASSAVVRSNGEELDWPDTPHGGFRSGVWCHGSAGVAQTFARLFRLTDDPRWLGLARGGLHTALRFAPRIGPTQCHGLAGLIEVLLDVADVDSGGRWRSDAGTVATRLLDYYAVDSEIGPLICSERPEVLTAEFMVGASGAMAALSRLVTPGRFSSVLRPPREAFTPVRAEASGVAQG